MEELNTAIVATSDTIGKMLFDKKDPLISEVQQSIIAPTSAHLQKKGKME